LTGNKKEAGKNPRDCVGENRGHKKNDEKGGPEWIKKKIARPKRKTLQPPHGGYKDEKKNKKEGGKSVKKRGFNFRNRGKKRKKAGEKKNVAESMVTGGW